ncbi:hypothetical protein CSAL01_01780 [Colletotrichum salicis]|uniref:Uncharacterized protein n=1 Tax=Colletotrichum salicis TaxID=1209931 RepID=A0A135V6L0_9PEZI|nr:hypothetical protein CSAL01_01780 [Colletotrichum salicis]
MVLTSLSIPPNVKVEIHDLEEPWAYSQPFDYIHTRAMNSSITDWKVYIKKYFDAPGIPIDAPLPPVRIALVFQVSAHIWVMYIPKKPIKHFLAIHDVGISDAKRKAMDHGIKGTPQTSLPAALVMILLCFIFFMLLAFGASLLVHYLEGQYNPPAPPQYYYGDNRIRLPELLESADQTEPLPRYEREEPTERPLFDFEGSTPPPAYGTVFHIPAPCDDEDNHPAKSSPDGPDRVDASHMV